MDGSPDGSILLPSTLSFDRLRVVSEVEPLRDSEQSRTVTVLSLSKEGEPSRFVR